MPESAFILHKTTGRRKMLFHREIKLPEAPLISITANLIGT